MAVIKSRGDWPVDSQQRRQGKGPLITVKRGTALVKMYQKDAEEAGLVETKSLPKPQDKSRRPGLDKAIEAIKEFAEGATSEEVPSDDFTSIPNIGPATARALNAHGITTFDQLRAAGHIEYISIKAMDSIKEWRDG